MKKAENFDKIFAQRGEQVQPGKRINGNTYLVVAENKNQLIAVVHSARLGMAALGRALASNGEYMVCGHARRLGGEILTFFEATPDQIELLNSYRV